MVPEEDKFKFIDDNTITDVVDVKKIGMASYNVKQHVPSDVPSHNQIIPNNNLKSQEYMTSICKWSDKMKMKLNPKKCTNMIFNFSQNHQFSTNIKVKEHVIQTVDKTKLLGTIIDNKLKWDLNTEKLVKEANKRLFILSKASQFTSRISDLKAIYNSKVRSILETSCVVWHSSLTMQHRAALERIQKSACRIMLKNSYESYDQALTDLNMDTLEVRRRKLCIKFAKSCLKHEKFRSMFPVNKSSHKMDKKHGKNKFFETKCKTERYKKSSIPFMQRILNEENRTLERMIG